VLTTGGLPQWLGWVATLLAVVLVAGVVSTQLHGTHRRPAAAPTTSRQAPPPTKGADEVLDIVNGANGGQWVLTGSTLASVDGTRVERSVPLGRLAMPSDSRPQLTIDQVTGRLWIVVADVEPAMLVEYDTASLRVLRRLAWPQLVHGGVAYEGHLYLATDIGVAELAPGAARPRLIAGLGAANGPMALDAARGRLVIMNVGYPTRVWTYRPGQLPISTGVALPLGGGTVTVVGAAIWVGGFSDRGAVLAKLNPKTLRPVIRAAKDPYGPGSVIIAGGASVLWVRPGNGTDVLACADARTGRIEQRWQLAAVTAVASQHGGALVLTRGSALGLLLSGCAG
jgi:hypothetical protein